MSHRLASRSANVVVAVLVAAMCVATAIGWSNYRTAAQGIVQRAIWLGELATLHHDLVVQSLHGGRLDFGKCGQFAAEVAAGQVGTEVATKAQELLSLCSELAVAPPEADDSEQLSRMNDAITALTRELRSQNGRLSERSENSRTATTVLFGVVAVVSVVMGLAALRAAQLRKVEEDSSRKLLEEVKERVKVSEALKQSEERLAATLYSIGDAVIATDENGLLELMNPVAERLTGWDFEEAKGRKLDEVLKMVQEGNNRPTGDPFEHISRGGGTEPRRQVRVVARDGTSIPVERTVAAMQGPRSFLGIVVGLRDMSEERRAARDLEQVHRDFRQVIERSPDGVAIQRDGLLVYINPALASLLGYRSRDSLLHYSLVNLVHPTQRAEARTHLADPEIQTLPGTTKDIRFLKADGELAILELTPGVVVSYEGERSVLIVARDVTERQRILQRLVQMDRLTSVGSLTGGIVNQINNPLSVATSGVVQVLEEIATLPLPESRRILQDVRERLDGIDRIVRDLRSFSVAEETRPHPVDIRRVLEACVRLTQADLRARGTIQERYSEVRPVLASEPHLRHLLVNVLLHALNQWDEDRKGRNELTLVIEPDGERVKVMVADNGPGLFPEELAHIFDPMRNPQRLGLALCQGLAAEMGARIRIESAPGRGSRVVIDLPTANYASTPRVTPRPVVPDVGPESREPGTEAGAENSGEPVTVDPQTALRILIIDDDAMVAKALKRNLRGQDVVIATSGREGVEMCDRRIFDLVICDLMMEEMSGMDVYDYLRPRHPELVDRMVFMTGGAFTPRGRQFLDLVDNPRISKPFHAEEIREIVQAFRRRAS